MNKQRNIVAKHMGSVNRPTIHIDRKKVAKNKQARREVAEAKRSWLCDLI